MLRLTENELCSDADYFRNDVEIDRFTEMTDQYCVYWERTHFCKQALKHSTGCSGTFHSCIFGVAAHRLTYWINIFLLFSHFLPSLLLLSSPHIWPNCVIWKIDFPPLLFTISKPFILKHFHIAHPAPPPGTCSHVAQVWAHFSGIWYSFYSTACQIRSMKIQKLP